MDYVKVDVKNYVRDGITSGKLIPREAERFARIIARRGNTTEEVISWSVDNDGKEIKEKVAIVNDGDWIATKVNDLGEVIIDNNGHANEWIIDGETFKKKYEVDPENEYLFKPKGGVQVFVQIPDNIILEQWGSDMKIARGGYINITNPNDMYGISERDFLDTYRFCYEMKKEAGR